MACAPVRISKPTFVSPLVVDSPHSGREYPADFIHSCPRDLLRQTEDFYVDELVSRATEVGVTVVTATFPRSYIDVNRAENDIDPDVIAGSMPFTLNPSLHTLQGLGLVRRLCRSGVPVYAAPLAPDAIMRRIEHYYRPYHAALQNTLRQCHSQFGFWLLLNMHSMPDGTNNHGNPRADIILGDRDGTSCDPAMTNAVQQLLTGCGYSVAMNNPYKGVEIARRYGQLLGGQNALQIEINRRLYMNEITLELHHGFDRLQQDLTQLFSQMAEIAMRTHTLPLAAE
jgi:hypothetical protein